MGERKSELTHYVGIGASAGGLEAIETFFTSMPRHTGLAFIVVQHLSPDYKSLMVELLSKKTDIPVHRAEDGMEVLEDNIYLIPPKKNMTIFHGRLLLKDQGGSRGINLPIDIFLRSLAEDQAERSIAVILSGTGSDGTRGVRAIKEFGGMVMVQNEESAKFDGMPRAAISTGVADFILTPDEMPGQLLAFVEHPYVSKEKRAAGLLSDEDSLTRIFAELRGKTKVDFTYYKPSTITRRIERRMMVNQIHDIGDYVRFLRDYPGEVMTLYRELLIGVTSFFRDPPAMSELMNTYLPEMLVQSKDREVRFWVAGCSTGEEAYTLAILARETMQKNELNRDVKIFATDIDRDAILTAGAGVYPESITADLTPQLLGKYFYKKDDNYQIARNVREMVVFAQHNLIKDPPFTNIDLVSCRNLLIYLQPILQQKALEMFNFSLNTNGLLFLGTSETVGEMAGFFETVHQKFKIFRSKGKAHAPGQTTLLAGDGKPYQARASLAPEVRRRHAGPGDDRLMNRYLEVLSAHYVPLSVIVNEQMEAVHILGDTEGFLKVPSGRAAFDITKMAVEELAIPLATGLQRAFRTREETAYTNIRLTRGQEVRVVSMRILPLPEKKGQEPFVGVFLEDMKREKAKDCDRETVVYDIGEEARQHIVDLEQELQFTKENLQATIEELETSNEELQATNEELLASNEELQSTNEELQSTNEELFTVNAEYQNKIIELTELNNDVDNLLTHSRIGTLMLDEDLEIRKYSPEIVKIFKIMEKDIGRPLGHLSHKLIDFDPIEACRTVQDRNKPIEQEVRSRDGLWYLVRILPYHIGPETFSGIVITFIDITLLKNTQNHLERSRRTSQDIIQYMPAGLFIYSLDGQKDLVLESANPEAERLTGIRAHEAVGRRFEDLWPLAGKHGIMGHFQHVLESGETYYGENVDYRDERLQGVYRIHAFKLPGHRLAVSFEDITARRRAEEELRASERKYRTLYKTMAQGVVYQDADGRITSVNPSAERVLGLSFDQMRGRTSADPRWRAMREDGTDLPGEEHPSMVALRTAEPVYGFIMGVYNPQVEDTRWIMVNAVPDVPEGESTPCQVYTTFEDITERVDFERRLKKAGERLDFAFRTAGLAWWDWDRVSGELAFSDHKAELIGFTPEEAGHDLEFWTSRIHPKDYERVMQAMRDHLEGRKNEYEAQYRLKKKDGTYVELLDRGKTVEWNTSGNPCRVLGTVKKKRPEHQ